MFIKPVIKDGEICLTEISFFDLVSYAKWRNLSVDCSSPDEGGSGEMFIFDCYYTPKKNTTNVNNADPIVCQSVFTMCHLRTAFRLALRRRSSILMPFPRR